MDEFILYVVDLVQPCRKFAEGLNEMYEGISLEELVRVSETVETFPHENSVNKKSADLLSSSAYFQFYYIRKNKPHNFGSLFNKEYDSARGYGGSATLKILRAFFFEQRSNVCISCSPGWSLANQTEMPELKKAKNSNFCNNTKINFDVCAHWRMTRI